MEPLEVRKQVLSITIEQWHAKKSRGLTVMVFDRPYIVMMHEATHEPVYQPVAILERQLPP